MIQLNGKNYWIFHGDVFDASVMFSPWIAKLGGKSYDLLIRINRIVNHILLKFGKARMSFSHHVKSRVKRAVKFINDFEQIAIEHAFDKSMDYVVCGHIHEPIIRSVERDGKKVIYMNSGDWIENLSALEMEFNEWKIYKYNNDLDKIESEKFSNLELFDESTGRKVVRAQSEPHLMPIFKNS
ncbi:MAG: hypothetical protein M3Q56_03880 [Bacteroidota bacterium]|nr:hypothetical protein [Bacteroidota bacterium]